MPVLFHDDAARLERVLRDLLKTTHGQAPMLEFEKPPAGTTSLQGIANRSGLFRFGVQLALAALKADLIVSVNSDGSILEVDTNGPVKVVLVEESPLPQQRPKRLAAFLIVCMNLLVWVVFIFAMIGFGTVARWLGDWLKSS